MSQRVTQLLTVGLALAAILIALTNAPSAEARPPLGVSNMDSLHLSDFNGTATPNFLVNQRGSGALAEFRDGGTPIVQMPNGGGLTVNSGGLTVAAGGLTVTAGGLSITDGNLTAPDWLNISEQTAISVTQGSVITPTGTNQPLNSWFNYRGCNTTKCIEDGSTTGDLLILTNIHATNSITIDGTGANVECKADVVLVGGDTLVLKWDGTDWACLSSYDNS